MNIKYQIFPAEKLLILKFTGDFNIEFYTQFSKSLTQITQWNEVEKVITDVRDLNLNYKNISININIVSDIRRNILKKDYTNVFVVNTPLITATSHLYQSILKQENFKYEYHSTLKETIKTLELDFDEDLLEQHISNLENTFVLN